MTLVWALLRQAWPLLLGGLFLFGAWQIVQSHRQVSEEKGRLEQKVETLNDDLAATDAVADVLADQAEDARQAERKRARELNQLRGRYEGLRRELQGIARAAPAGDCLNQPVHPDAGRLLNDAGKGRNTGAGLSDPVQPGTP